MACYVKVMRGNEGKEVQEKLEQPFLQAVSTTLGDRYTENVENIYKITIKFIIEAVIRGFERTPQPTKAQAGAS
ncbi:Cytoglobin-1-like protein [Gryllus bimaculatus]|nr:Cytoglobin-1-like protein [Gryllus bimaculatus]